jgi:hypothetical protein
MAKLTARDEALFRIQWAIERHGFFIQYVLGDPERPPWAYTIGFLEHDHPEAVVIGLDPESAAGLLHELHRRILAGDRPVVGRWEAHEYRGLPFRLVPIPPDQWLADSDLLLGCVDYYYGVRREFPSEPRAVQLVWADDDRHLPWDDGFATHLRRLQPLLDEDAWSGETP